MLLSDERRQSILFWTRIASRTTVALSVICAVVFRLSKDSPDLLSSYAVYNYVVANMWWILPFLLIVTPMIEGFRRWAERQVLWPLVKALLEDFRNSIYPDSNDVPHEHRVTLFKHSSWVFRKKTILEFGLGWVHIIVRTGHTTQNSRTIFRATNDPDKAQGVAGATWTINRLSYFEDLPDLSANPSEKAIATFAQKTSCPVEEIRRRKPRCRSLCGIPVEVKGRVWGVLVIDSRNSKLPKDLIQTHYYSVAKSLGRLLERLS